MYYPYGENEIRFSQSFTSHLTEASVLERLDPEKMGYKKDSIHFYRMDEYEDFYYRIKDQKDSAEKWLPLKNSTDSALFVRKQSASFFIIPRYVLEGDTLYNLELSIDATGRKKNQTVIQIGSFQTKIPSAHRDFYDGKMRKRYKKYFKALFRG